MTPKPKVPLTPIEALRKAASRGRLDVDDARALVSDLEDEKGLAQGVADLDLNLAVPELVTALEPLVETGLLHPDVLRALADAYDTVEAIAGTAVERAQVVVDAWDTADEKVSECETHRDSERGEYDADTKADARDQAQDALSELADALDIYQDRPTEETP